MSDIKRVLDAMAALAKALPGAPYVGISLSGCDDATLRLLEQAGARIDRLKNSDGSQEWDYANLLLDDISLMAHGHHRPIGPVSLNESDVNAALAQAEAAVRS